MPIANVDSFSNIQNILNLVKSPGDVSSTTTNNISQAGIQKTINDILGSTQGLASIAGGAKNAGVYGGATSQLLINNLLTQTAGEAAKLNASTTTTKHQAPTFSPIQLIKGYALGKGLQFGSKALGLDKLGKVVDKKLEDYQDQIANYVKGIGGPSDSAVDAAINSVGGVGASSTDLAGFTALDSAASQGIDLGSVTGVASDSATADALSSVGSNANTDVAGFTALDSAAYSSDAATAADVASVASDAPDVAGLAALDSASYASDASTAAEASGSIFSDLAPAAAISNIGGDIGRGDIPEVIGDFFGGSLGGDLVGKATDSWVICTELNRGGELNDELYQASAQRALHLSYEVLEGYRYWAVPATRILRTGAYRKLAAFIAIKRCEYLLGKRNWIGWATVSIGEPICGFIGKRLIATGKYAEDWKELYARN